ncbi:MAG: biotin/lipoyl-binding protein [Nitrospirota bacterium]
MENIKTENQMNKKKIAILIFSFIAIAGIIIGYFYVQYKKTHITTDDAFVEGRIHTIASKVPGTIKNVYVTDNQFIRKGDLLVEIDPEDFDVKVREASAVFDVERTKLSEFFYRLDASRKRFEELKAMLEAAKANLELQEANLKQTEIDLKRAEGLYKEEIIPKEKYEKAKTAYDIADAQVRAAKEQLRQIEASLGTQKINIKQAESAIEPQKALIRQKEASLKMAGLNRSYTKIYAPSDGYITQ